MAANPKFELQGFNELIATLKELGGSRLAKKANRRAVNLAVTPMLQAARSNCPQDKGALKDSLTKKVTNKGYQANGIVGADRDYVGPDGEKPSHYDHLVEFGHQTHEGGTVAPHPFLRPAYDETAGPALDKYGEILAEEIEKAATKGSQ